MNERGNFYWFYDAEKTMHELLDACNEARAANGQPQLQISA